MTFPPGIRSDLLRDEGLRLKPYPDPRGKLTVGVGRNLTDTGITSVEAVYLLDNDLTRITVGLRTALPWFDALDGMRQRALLNLAFNVGVTGALGFRKMLAALERRDYDEAAEELLASQAAEELPSRYHRLALMLRTGQTV